MKRLKNSSCLISVFGFLEVHYPSWIDIISLDFRNAFSVVPHIGAISVSQKALEGWWDRNCQRQQFNSGLGHQEPREHKQKCEIFTGFKLDQHHNFTTLYNPPTAQDLEKEFRRLGPKQQFLACQCKEKSPGCCPAPRVSDLCHQSWLECWRGAEPASFTSRILRTTLGQARSCWAAAEWFLSPTPQRGSIRFSGTVWSTVCSWDSTATCCPYLGWITGLRASPRTFFPF